MRFCFLCRQDLIFIINLLLLHAESNFLLPYVNNSSNGRFRRLTALTVTKVFQNGQHLKYSTSELILLRASSTKPTRLIRRSIFALKLWNPDHPKTATNPCPLKLRRNSYLRIQTDHASLLAVKSAHGMRVLYRISPPRS